MWVWNTYKNYEDIMCHKRRIAKMCTEKCKKEVWFHKLLILFVLCGDSMNIIVNALMDNDVIYCDMFCIYWRSSYLSRHLRSRWHSGLGGSFLNFVLRIPIMPLSGCLPLDYSCPGHFSYVILQYALHEVTLEDYPEASAGVECICTNSCGCPRMAHVTRLLRDLHWIPVCFQI